MKCECWADNPTTRSRDRRGNPTQPEATPLILGDVSCWVECSQNWSLRRDLDVIHGWLEKALLLQVRL